MSKPRQCRSRIAVRGAVQGVGFRPFVYRLARELGLSGSVTNTAQGVLIEIEGPGEQIQDFLLRLRSEKPPRSFLQSVESSFLDPKGHSDFEILPSSSGEKTALVLPDIATCPDCLRELFDPGDRRFRYPFTNCTNCGPRFSIILSLPYDRPSTTMRGFQMCPACLAEYQDPLDRRFHAQPNACAECGPHLEFLDAQGGSLATRDPALPAAAAEIRKGAVVAVKGLGGFHLLTDARNSSAVDRLRIRKHREEKPFALMFPNLELVREHTLVSAAEELLLQSPESPIVLLRKRFSLQPGLEQVADSVAPGNPDLGIMLPYTPLHHLLLSELGFPIVATSGNLSDEPICTSKEEALQRLRGIADYFLMHDRPIARHVDDSLVRLMRGRELVLRRARGYAPLPLYSPESRPSILAVGGHLKNTVAVSLGQNIFVSQHIGDLETSQAYGAFEAVIESFRSLYDLRPEAVACDLHPDYLSTRFAQASGLTAVPVQHHHAHILACMAENELEPPLLGIAWDGTGYGLDKTVWGGEFFKVDRHCFLRFAHFRNFRLAGGEKAIQQPCRTALGILWEILGEQVLERHDLPPLRHFSENESMVLVAMLRKRLNSPECGSVGRLFDAVASLTGLRQEAKFEGQAAMQLEFAVHWGSTGEHYPFRLEPPPDGTAAGWTIDWQPLFESILADRTRGESVARIATMFHNSLCEIAVAVAKLAQETNIVLSGGCFQNHYLTERMITRLEEEGFRPYWHQRVPPNDGGIAVGQIIAAAERFRERGNDVPGCSG